MFLLIVFIEDISDVKYSYNKKTNKEMPGKLLIDSHLSGETDHPLLTRRFDCSV